MILLTTLLKTSNARVFCLCSYVMIYRGLKKYHVTRWWKVDKKLAPVFFMLFSFNAIVLIDKIKIRRSRMKLEDV